VSPELTAQSVNKMQVNVQLGACVSASCSVYLDAKRQVVLVWGVSLVLRLAPENQCQLVIF
jgi:hypothetical protein